MVDVEVYPVELLRDHDGVFGIGLVDDFPFGETGPHLKFDHSGHKYRRLRPLILRPDVLAEGATVKLQYSRENAVLQRIMSPKFGWDTFHRVLENQYRAVIEQAMMQRHGVLLKPGAVLAELTKDLTKEQRVQFWRKYHGIKRASAKLMNRLIGKLLEEATDPDVIRVARRFHFDHREAIYHVGALNPRALQLAEAFPLLATWIYASPLHWRDEYREEQIVRSAEAAKLVEKGASLKRVAAVMGVPLHLRKVLPGAYLGRVSNVLWEEADFFFAYLPGTTRAVRRWLTITNMAEDRDLGPEFVRWVAKHALQFEGKLREIKIVVEDLGDFVRACKRDEPHVVRRFSPNMSMRTVSRLSADWHAAVQSAKGPRYTFPRPWCPSGEVNGYEIAPIDSSRDLYHEGAAMHNCAGTYADRVMDGDVYIYSIRRAGERVATLEIVKTDDGVKIGQLRGPCNKPAAKEIAAAARHWLQMQTLPGRCGE